MKVLVGIYRVWLTILTAAVVVQIFLAGYGAFDSAHKLEDEGSTIDQDSFNSSFDPHIALGFLILFGAIILLVLSFLARGKARILRSLGVVGLVFLQIVLAEIGFGVPYVAGGLHPLNAFIILGFLLSLTYREWKGERTAAADPAAA